MSDRTTQNVSYLSDNTQEYTLKEMLFNIKGWYNFLLLKKMPILLTVLLGATIGLVYAFVTPPVYIATSTFVLADDSSPSGGLGQYAGIASMVGIDLGGGGDIFQGDNIIELYKSKSMIQNALFTSVKYQNKDILLIDRYIEVNKVKNIQSNFTAHHPFTRAQDSILNLIIKKISNQDLAVTKPDKKLSIIEIKVRSVDEFFAKEFNNQIVKNVNDFYIQTKTRKAFQNMSILQHQTDSVRGVLNHAISKAATVMDATPNLNPAKQILRVGSQKSQYDAETNKAMLSELIKNLEFAKLSLRKETPLIQIIDSPSYPLDKDRVSRSISLILGGLIGGFLAIGYLSIGRFIKNAMA